MRALPLLPGLLTLLSSLGGSLPLRAQAPLPAPAPAVQPAPATLPLLGGGSGRSSVRPPSLASLGNSSRLSFRYNGPGLSFQSGQMVQEVLVLVEPVTDAQGQVIVPAGVKLVGRFETSANEGSRFIAQRLLLSGSSRPVFGSSDVILTADSDPNLTPGSNRPLSLATRLEPNQTVAVTLLSGW